MNHAKTPKQLDRLTKDLLNRATMPIRETFTDWGCIALESVIKGRISHPDADRALMMLRDCVLDRGGDLMNPVRMREYIKQLKEPEDSIDLTWYQDEYEKA